MIQEISFVKFCTNNRLKSGRMKAGVIKTSKTRIFMQVECQNNLYFIYKRLAESYRQFVVEVSRCVDIRGVRCQCSALPRARKTASQIEKETLKKRITNIEQGILNYEVRYSIINIAKKSPRVAIPHFIIRNFLFDIRHG